MKLMGYQLSRTYHTGHFLPLGQFPNVSMWRNLKCLLKHRFLGPIPRDSNPFCAGWGGERVNVHFSQALGMLSLMMI